MFGRKDTLDTSMQKINAPKLDKKFKFDVSDEEAKSMVKKRGNAVGKLLRIQDIVGFFMYDLNPALIDGKIEATIAKEKQGLRQFNYAIVIAFIMIVMVGAIAYSIVMGQINTSACNQQLLACVGSNANYTAPTTQTPSNPAGILQPIVNAGGATIK